MPLPLQTTARTICYTQIVAALKADPVLADVVAPESWTTFLEDPTVKNLPYDVRTLPAIRLLPYGMPASSLTNVRQNAPFGISVSLTVAGHDIRDLFNFWGAFEYSIFKGDGLATLYRQISEAIEAEALAQGRQLGSFTGLVLTGSPMILAGIDNEEQPFISASGTMAVAMQVPR
jgi:hypothetical protein